MPDLIDQNFGHHATAVAGQMPDMQVYRSAALSYVDSGLNCDTFNIIHLTDCSILAFEELAAAIQHFRSKELAYCLWVNEENLSQNVQEYFTRLDLHKQSSEVAMILDMDYYSPIESPRHTYIQLVDSPELLAAYAGVIAANWTPPDENVHQWYRRSAEHYLQADKGIQLLLYFHEGQPAGSLELFPTNDQVIGCYGLATLATHRRMGIGSQLMTYGLNRCKTLGYRQVVLQASEDGIGIYRKYGFTERSLYFEYA